MLKLTDEQKAIFADAVRAALESPSALHIDAIYERFEQARAVRQPVCNQSGRCCRFEQFGHRLFVTTLEMARFWILTEGRSRSGNGWDGTGCVFQVEGLCSVHLSRPFGCRAYFCDPTATDWQNEQYERFHREIRELHESSGVSYLYVEWREALVAMGVRPDSKAADSARTGPIPRGLTILP